MNPEQHRRAQAYLTTALGWVNAARGVGGIPERQRDRLVVIRKLINSVRNDLDELTAAPGDD
jgi:hypothetical protein